MAKVTVDFEVTKDKVSDGWIAVGAEDVDLDQDGKGSLPVDDTGVATLVWWFLGDPGGTLKIVGKVGDRTVVEVTSKVPKKKDHGAGFRDFTV